MSTSGRGLDPARLDARQREDSPSSVSMRAVASRMRVDEATRLFRLGERTFVEHLGAGAYRGDRVLQLVREVGGEGLDERAPLELAAHRVDGLA